MIRRRSRHELDRLRSASYGPKAALTALAPLGAARLRELGWSTVPIVTRLVSLYPSYR